MNRNVLIHILKEEFGAIQAEARYDLPAGMKLSVFVASPGALLGVSKVTALTLKDHYIILDSEEGRVFTEAETILGIRVDEEKSQRRGLGFGQ